MPSITCASRDVLGRQISCLDDICIGIIRELVVNQESGRVRYVIVEPREEAMGVENGVLAIPWRALSPVTNDPDRAFVLPLLIDDAKQAPTFEAGSWPDFSNTREMAEVHAFYGEPPA